MIDLEKWGKEQKMMEDQFQENKVMIDLEIWEKEQKMMEIQFQEN